MLVRHQVMIWQEDEEIGVGWKNWRSMFVEPQFALAQLLYSPEPQYEQFVKTLRIGGQGATKLPAEIRLLSVVRQ